MVIGFQIFTPARQEIDLSEIMDPDMERPKIYHHGVKSIRKKGGGEYEIDLGIVSGSSQHTPYLESDIHVVIRPDVPKHKVDRVHVRVAASG
jgi:hypothetical protein